MSETARIRADLAQMMDGLTQLAITLGTELARGRQASDAGLRRSMAEVTRLTIGFSQFIIRAGAIPATEPSSDHAALQRELSAARLQVAEWATYERMILGQISTASRPLYPRPDSATGHQSTRDAATDALLDVLHHVLNPAAQSDTARDHGCHADIALPHSIFARDVHAAYRVLLARRPAHPTRFLDVGCGGGLKVLAAARYFDRCDGLEYQSDYAHAADALLASAGAGTCRILTGDALTFETYADYDVIYFFRPLRSGDLLHRLEDIITQTARPGTLLIAPYLYFEQRHRHIGCAHIAGHLYLTQSSQAEADALRHLAEQTGLNLRPTRVPAKNIWQPIFATSAARGFAF
tara:strand:- start:80681 stop:81733 length:1053 start_codon:yes stop_codon:yes gene_type:complete